MSKRFALATAATAAAVAVGFGCGSGGSGSGGTPAGLDVPGQVTLVESKGANSLRGKLPGGVLGAGGTDYDNDRTDLWVHDDSMEPLDTVNMILCSIQQTGYDDPAVLNQGPYLALVACEDRGGQRGGQGRGGDSVQYERFIVDSSRANASAPHVVKCWIEQVDNGTPSIIYVKVTITASPSASAPYGSFKLFFKQLAANVPHDNAGITFRGYLKTVPRNDGQAEFAFFNWGGDVDANLPVGKEAFRQRARLVGSADGTSGRAYSESRVAYNHGSGTQRQGSEFFLQFNARYLARKKVSTGSTIKVFDRNSFDTFVYQYGLYDTAGTRVKRLSGFGLETAGGVHGWAGFHGLWFPDHVTITNGQQLTRRSHDRNEPDRTYTAVVVPGRLEKRSRVSITLGDVKNEDLEMFDRNLGTEIRVRWTGTDLVKVAQRTNNQWADVDPPTSITGTLQAGDWLRFYTAHRGSVEMRWPSSSPTDTTAAYIWAHETIHGGSSDLTNGTLTLHGYTNMLKPQLTQDQANYANSQTPYFADATNVSQGKTYTFAAADLLLALGSDKVTLGPGVTVTSGPGRNGFDCGPMFATALTSLDQMSAQTTTYQWRTGTNKWNQLRTLKDANGNYVSFDPPLRFDYTHNEPANTTYHNRSYRLEWEGRHLNGVPFLEDNTAKRWTPAFNIPNGTVLTSGNGTYKLKQLEGEQVMRAVSDPNAVIASEGFDLDTTLTAPTDEWIDPAIGAMPAITAAPKFVAGELQAAQN